MTLHIVIGILVAAWFFGLGWFSKTGLVEHRATTERLILAALRHKPQTALDLCLDLGRKPGTLYPDLVRLENAERIDAFRQGALTWYRLAEWRTGASS